MASFAWKNTHRSCHCAEQETGGVGTGSPGLSPLTVRYAQCRSALVIRTGFLGRCRTDGATVGCQASTMPLEVSLICREMCRRGGGRAVPRAASPPGPVLQRLLWPPGIWSQFPGAASPGPGRVLASCQQGPAGPCDTLGAFLLGDVRACGGGACRQAVWTSVQPVPLSGELCK